MPGTMQWEQIAIQGDQFTASLTALPAEQIVVAGRLIDNLHPALVLLRFLARKEDGEKSIRIFRSSGYIPKRESCYLKKKKKTKWMS